MFDYIVVGAGSAGCVLANRLSANPDVSVLLLEAGGAGNAREISIPAATPLNFRTDRDWAFQTESQKHLTGSSLYWPRGRVLGGSSAINFMIYMRGNRLDYDDWARNGCDGWSFDEVLPYFQRAEHRESGRNGDYGRDGPLNITDLRSLNPLTTAFVEAAIDSGFSRNSDFNGPEQDGAGYYQVTQKNGARVSCASAYLTPIRSRRNLTVRTGTLVGRVLIENNRAVGVECVQGANVEKLHAEREVVLSAGTVNSPQLLMLSGIGPAGHLEGLDIPVEVDLPGVGENLQDHLLVPVIYESTRPVSMASAGGLRDLAAYFLLKRGPLTSNIAEAGGFARTDSVQPAPDLQFNCAPVFYMTRGHEMRKGHGFSMSVVGLRPESRGHIRLRSNNPLDPPVIQPDYLAESSDLDTLVGGVKWAREIAAATPFDEYRGSEVWPGQEIEQDDEIAHYIRQTAESASHPVGTCRMGTGADAVVDPMLRVHDIEGLRVVDASVMPKITRGNTNAPTVMIGEKGADQLRFIS